MKIIQELSIVSKKGIGYLSVNITHFLPHVYMAESETTFIDIFHVLM